MDVSDDLQALVDRRTALRTRMMELRSNAPDDHDGFLRTVDQLLAVSNQIVDVVSAPPDLPTPDPGSVEGDPTPVTALEGDPTSASALEGGAHEGPAGGAEDDAG